MAISTERAKEFSHLGTEEMLEWLTSGVEEFFREGHGPEAFAPFELFFPFRRKRSSGPGTWNRKTAGSGEGKI